MNSFQPNAILLRYGEVALKSARKRPFFERLYVSALKDVVSRHKVEAFIKNYGGRFIIHSEHVLELVDSLQQVPGVQSFSLAQKITFSSLQDLAEQVGEVVGNRTHNKTFAVRARRVGKHDFSSLDLAKAIAECVFENSVGVDLKTPDVEIFVEVRNDESFVYFDSKKGIGGMPPASSGRAISLFSGGIDSPVASYLMLKRGIALDYVYVDLANDDETFVHIAQLFSYLSSRYSFNYQPKLYRVNAKTLVSYIHKNVKPCFSQLALKIAFYQIGLWFEKKYSYGAIITGESLAQKSSQTLASLQAIASQSQAFVLRPLVAMDKEDITIIARDIGTFSFSTHVKEYCDLSEGNSVTATPQLKDMARLPDFSTIITPLCEDAFCYSVKQASEVTSDTKTISKEDLKGCICVDTRRASVAKEDALINTISKYYYLLLDELESFSQKDVVQTNFFSSKNSYVFICEHGVLARNLVSLCKEKWLVAKACSVFEFKELLH